MEKNALRIKAIVFRILHTVLGIVLFVLLLKGFDYYVVAIPENVMKMMLIIGSLIEIFEPHFLYQFVKMAVYWIVAWYVSSRWLNIQDANYLFGIGFIFSTICFHFGVLEKLFKLVRMLVSLILDIVLLPVRKILMKNRN